MNKRYEDLQDEIENLLSRYRAKWQLDAIAWMDYEDVCQIIRVHIHKKWHLWDQSRPFGPWVARLIHNQIKNQIRNHYTNYAKPCFRCPYFLGGNECGLLKSGEQGPECEDYAKWQKKKEVAYNLKLPLSFDPSISTGETCINEGLDYEEKAEKLHELVMKELSGKHKRIYYLLYVKHEDEHVVAEEFGFRAEENHRKTPRYKQINNLRKRFYKIAQRVIKENDLL